MTELFDPRPEIAVQPEEFHRLLGYPPGWVIADRAAELAEWAREWYARNGRPWIYARQSEELEIRHDSFSIAGACFTSPRLRRTLEDAEATSVVLVAVSAGPELEQAAQDLWLDGKPDEYFFLESYGSAVVEYLNTLAGARLCAWADHGNLAVLPHYSPGYPEWDIGEQPRLLDMMRRQGMPDGMEVLDSGALRPKKSLLAVFGLTHHTAGVLSLANLVPCDNCSMLSCQFRRTAYRNAARNGNGTALGLVTAVAAQPAPPHTVNLKALKRWSGERLSLTQCEDGSIAALFRYDGTTCTNTGRQLTFHYHVKLGPAGEGYPIRAQRCQPAPGDTGHTLMCRYQEDREALMAAIDREKPLAGRPLQEALAWERQACAAGCYCDRDSRDHKWGLVFETIYYALSQTRNGTS
jgi:hypothetical protein